VSAVAKDLGLQEHDIEIIKSWKAQVRYLTHLDDEDKVKYDTKDIVANTPIEKYLFLEKEECESALEILEEILDKDIRDPFTLMKFVCSRPDLYAAYRRNGASFMECMRFNAKAYRESMDDIKAKLRQTDSENEAYKKGRKVHPGFTPFTALKKDDPALHAFDDEDEIDF
ncbi:MAG: Rep family protein, partial [Bacillota bacterium]|nr:Rep family protein [Bacillota bacterium]